MDWVQYIPFNDITVNFIIISGGFLVFTRKIIWHTDYERLLKENDELKALVFRLLGVSEKLTSQQEVVTKVATDDEGSHHS